MIRSKDVDMARYVLSAYDRSIADFLGVRHAFSFWKGRVALYALLRTLGIGEGDEVILPGYTCVMNVNPIMYVGAKPVYVDIEPVTYNMVPELIAEKITDKTRLIIAQHTYGYPADMDAILAIGKEHEIPVVEDCCLSLGSTYHGRLTGTFGVAAYFSSQWSKPYTTGLGGVLVTNSDELASHVDQLRQQELVAPGGKETMMLAAQLAVYRAFIYPRTTALATNVFRWLTRKGIVVGSSATSEFVPEMESDFFKDMSRVQRRAGRRQMRRMGHYVAHRRDMTRRYDQLLTHKGWDVPDIPEHMDPVLVRYPVRVADKARALATAASHFVEIGSWFECPLHPIETPLEAYHYRGGMCPVAEQACREVVNLPTHPRTGQATAHRSVDFVTGIGPAETS